MKSEVCSEKDRISMIVHDGNLTQTNSTSIRSCKVSKTILLPQEPRETALLEFSLSVSPNHNYHYSYHNNTYSLEYKFSLTFEDNLHDVSMDYGYEIEFSIYAHENDLSMHTLLFSQKEMRKTNKIYISNKFNYNSQQSHPEFYDKLLVDTKKRHMCCTIQRFNIKKEKEVNKLPSPHMDFSAMLFETGLYSDVTLAVGEELFKVHKHVLSCASDIFKAMFSHEMSENQNSRVTIEDFQPEVVKGLLSFIYTGKTSLLSKMPIELFQIAHKYEIETLKTQCMEQFLFWLNSKNVVNILYTASIYELTDLRTDLFKFIQVHEKEMVKEGSFQQFLCDDLKIDTVVYTLKLCDKYKDLLIDVKTETFKFVKENNETLVSHSDFLKLFVTHALLMQRLYVFIHKKN